jgi:predicted RecA/RadA family phage recombinase
MLNFKQPGASIEYINSGSAIASGDVVPLVDSVGVALTDIAATTGKGTVMLEGVFECAKDGDESFEIGDQLYYDASDATMTKTAAGNTPAGKAHEAAITAAEVCLVKLVPSPQRAAKVADASSGSAAEINALRDALIAAGLMKNA